MSATEQESALVHDLRGARSAGELLDSVRRLANELEALAREHPDLPGPIRVRIATATTDVRRRMDRKELYVAVVGEFKAGKSTFLNAMLGARLLGSATTECTGTVTFLREGAESDYSFVDAAGRVGSFIEEVPDLRPTLQSAVSRAIDFERSSRARHADAVAHQTVAFSEFARRDADARQAREVELEAAALSHSEAVRTADARMVLNTAEDVEQRLATVVPAFLRETPRWWAFGWWIARFLIGWFWASKRSYWLAASNDAARARATAESAAARSTETAAKRAAAHAVATDACRMAEITLQRRNEAAAQLVSAESASAAATKSVPTARQALNDHVRERERRFRENVRDLGDIRKRANSVREVQIRHPAPRLRGGLVLMDTPGINTPNQALQDRAWDAIERDADACVLLTPVKGAMSQETRKSIVRIRAQVPHVALVLTQYDAALRDAFAGTGDEAEAHAECQEAIKKAVRRFATEVGRRPDDVFSIAVSAALAIPGEAEFDVAWARDFDFSLERLLRALAIERTTVIAVRCAGIATAAIASSGDAVRELEQAYRERIRALEENRLPDPKGEADRLLAMHRRALRDRFAEAAVTAQSDLRQRIDAMWISLASDVQSQPDHTHLDAFLKGVFQGRLAGFQRAVVEAASAQRVSLDRARTEESVRAANEIRERYRVVSRMASADVASPGINSVESGSGLEDGSSAQDFSSILSSHDTDNFAAGAVGAGTGATIGTFLLPGIGTAIGAVIGGFIGLAFGPSLDDLKKKVIDRAEEMVKAFRSSASLDLQRQNDALLVRAVSSVETLLQRQLVEFNAWIERLVREEERRIDAERLRLQGLTRRAESIEARTNSLAPLIESVARESALMARGESPRALASKRSN